MKLKHSKNLGRREFLQLSALGLAGASLGLAGCKTGGSCCSMKKIRVGVELYSVRNECKADFPGTLAKIAKPSKSGSFAMAVSETMSSSHFYF